MEAGKDERSHSHEYDLGIVGADAPADVASGNHLLHWYDGAYPEGGMMRYQGKYIRIGIVDNDALALEALQYVVRTYLPS